MANTDKVPSLLTWTQNFVFVVTQEPLPMETGNKEVEMFWGLVK